jgi:hypothetical protein
MSHNESNIVSLKLSEYVAKSDAEKVDRKGWVNYGDQNDFPQYLRDLSHESPVHGSLVVAIGDMIAGKGIQSEQYQAELDALEVDTLTYACAKDLKLFGGFFIEVIWSNDRTVISKLNPIPFEECRIAINQEDESEIGIYHSYDWSNIRKKKNTPEFIPKYNYLTREQEPRQIYWCFTYTGSDSYPRPDYWSAINYIELDKQISIFHINQISNGLFPSTIINFYNGQATPEQKQQMMMDWENKMSGARNAGKVVMFFNERDQPKTEITPFPVNDADKQYQLMDTTAQQKIITAHRVTTPLLFGIRETSGFGSNKDEMATGLEIFNKQVIEPYQAMINKSIEELLSNQLPGVTFEIVPNTPLAVEQAEVVVDTTGGATTDVAATALNGAQIASLVDIVMQSAAGALPVSSAQAIVGAAFPTLSADVVSAIFAQVVPGSLQPTEVIQSSVELKKKVVAAEESYEPTDEMAAEAELGLKWREEYGRGGTEVGVARARDISNKRNLSFDTVKRMYSYFSRHEVDKQATGWNQGEDGFPTAGRIAWQLWGGDAGQGWAARIVEAANKEELQDVHVAEGLIELGEDATSDMILIDAYNADDEINHAFAVRTGAARPAAKSEQDAIIDGKYFITRYVYAGDFRHTNMRPFCKKMLEAGKLYRKEDIVAMENVAVNPGWGPEGADTYDIWFYKGGGNCQHFWEKRVYVDAKGAKINPNDPDAKRIAVAMAERMGYKVRNNSLVAKLPTDMDYNGFLPTNPIYGNQ